MEKMDDNLHQSLQLPHQGWRGSLRGCDCWLSPEPDPGNWKLTTSSPFLGMYTLPAVPTVGAFSRMQP